MDHDDDHECIETRGKTATWQDTFGKESLNAIPCILVSTVEDELGMLIEMDSL